MLQIVFWILNNILTFEHYFGQQFYLLTELCVNILHNTEKLSFLFAN